MSVERSVPERLKRLVLQYLLITVAVLLLPPSASAQDQTTCVQCHEPQPGRGGAPVRPWRESVHAVNGISCHDCHGGDPKDAVNAMSPARGFSGVPKDTDIPVFCGRCHIGIKGDYLLSAHGKALGKGGPTCVTCHGSHGIKKAVLDLINEESCTRCHSYERAAKIKAAMQEVEGLIASSDRKIQQFKQRGFDTEMLEKGVFSTRNKYHRLFHDVNTPRVVAESGMIRGELDKLNTSLDAMAGSLQMRKRAGLVLVGLSLLAALLFYLLRKSYE